MASKYSYADARKRAEEHDRGFESTSLNLPEGVKLFKIKKAGIYRLDFLPYEVGKGNPYADPGQHHYERSYSGHRSIGLDENFYICPRETLDLPCPICEFQRKLKLDPTVDDKIVKSFYPKERQLFHIIDLDDKDDSVQVWDYSFHLFGKQLDARIRDSDERDGYKNFYHLQGGFSLRVGFEEEGQGKYKWFKATTIDFKPRADYPDSVVTKETYVLDDFIIVEPYDKLKEIFEQGASASPRGGANGDRERRGDTDRGRGERTAGQEARADQRDNRESRRAERSPAREEAPPAREERGRRDDPPPERESRGRGREAEPDKKKDNFRDEEEPEETAGGDREREERGRGSREEAPARGERGRRDDPPPERESRRGAREEAPPAREERGRRDDPPARGGDKKKEDDWD